MAEPRSASEVHRRQVPLLFQQTPFCGFAAERLGQMFRGRVLCEGIDADSVKPSGRSPAILLWGDGTNHHLSNMLNIPGSLKYVFDNHPDDATHGDAPAYDSHSHFSGMDGVVVRACYKTGPRNAFFRYDEREGNGLLHISVDLDFLEAFPSLPWMSSGQNSLGSLCTGLRRTMERGLLVSFDIGGYHGRGDETEMAAISDGYYFPLIELALSAIIP